MATNVVSYCDLDSLNAEFEQCCALDIIERNVAEFGDDLAVSSSFGVNCAVMLHLATRIKPDIKVITVDTGFLFPETIEFRETLQRLLNLNLSIWYPPVGRKAFLKAYGRLWRYDPDTCCRLNKQFPFDRAKRVLGIRCWLTGIRREQSPTRRNARIIERDHLGLLKLCPIATWSAEDVRDYLEAHDLPRHPLYARGYLSVGCRPESGYCTIKVEPGADARSGRWAGFTKTECGLHKFD